MSMYGNGLNMVYTNQVVVPSAGDAQAVLAKLQKTHLGYLHLEEGGIKLVTRKDMEGLITHHLSTVPHKEKFPCPKFLEILRRSIDDRSDFNACKAGQAFEALEDYAVNLLSQPWRAEFRCIRLYSGFYTHHIEAHLGSSARDVLHLMGYVPAEDSEMRLNEPIDPDRVTDVSLNCLIASVECKLMMKIMEAVGGRCTAREVAYVRRHNTCSESRAADILLKRDSKATESASRTVPARSKPRNEWRTGTTAHQNNGYVRVDRLVDISSDAPDGNRNDTVVAADERYPPSFTSWNRQSVQPSVVSTNGHYGGVTPLRPVPSSSSLRSDYPNVPPPDYMTRVRRQSSDPHPATQDGWEHMYDPVPSGKDRGYVSSNLLSGYDGRELQKELPIPPPRREPNGYPRRRLLSEDELQPQRQVYGGEPEVLHPSYSLQKRYAQQQPTPLMLPNYPYSTMPIAFPCHNQMPPHHTTSYLVNERDLYGTSAPSCYYRTQQMAPCPVIAPKHVCRTQVTYAEPPYLTNGTRLYDYGVPPTAAFPVAYGSSVRGQPCHHPSPSQQMVDPGNEFQELSLRDGATVSKASASNRRSLYDNVNDGDPAPTSETNGTGHGHRVAVDPAPSHHLHHNRMENPTTVYGALAPKLATTSRSAATATGDDEVHLMSTPAATSSSGRHDWNGSSDHRRTSSSVTPAAMSKLMAPPSAATMPHHNGITATKSAASDDRKVATAVATEATATRRRSSTSSRPNHERSPSVGSQRSAGVTSSSYSSSDGGATWNCSSCTFLNTAERDICEMCARSRMRGAESSPLSSGGQECAKCTLVNDATSDRCRACDQSLKDSPTYV